MVPLAFTIMGRFELTFQSTVSAPRERVWEWITSVDGISRELWPILRMTVPRHIATLRDVHVEPGKALFSSWVLLFGVLPIDRSHLTLIRLEANRGFLEQSPMLSMRLWRHERTLEPDAGGTIVTDHLTVEPRLATPLIRWFVRTIFTHRHAVLQRHFGSAMSGHPRMTTTTEGG